MNRRAFFGFLAAAPCAAFVKPVEAVPVGVVPVELGICDLMSGEQIAAIIKQANGSIVKEELSRIAFGDLSGFLELDENGLARFKMPHELTADEWVLVESYSVSPGGAVRYKLHDKIAAGEELIRITA